MHRFVRIAVLFLFCLLGSTLLKAQNSDSLVAIINSATNDSDKFNARILLADVIRVDYLDSALKEAKWCVQFANKSGNKQYQLEAYDILGDIYYDLGDPTKSLETFLAGLQVAEDLNNVRAQGGLMCNIGLVYLNKKDFEGAISSFRKAIPLALKSESRDHEANIYIGLASSYSGKGMRDSTLHYYGIAEKMFKETNDDGGLTVVWNNLGLLYLDSMEYDSALVFMYRSLRCGLPLGDYVNLSIAHNNIGDIFLGLEKPDSAMVHFRQGMNYAKITGALDLCRDAYVGVAKSFTVLQKFDSAYYYLDLAMGVVDTLYASDTQQQYADLKAGFDRDAADKELLIKTLENEKANREKSIFRTLLAITAVFVVVIVLVFMNRFKIKQKANAALALKNSEIEEKSKSITDSIHYAKLIQNGLLPDASEIANRFPHSFVMFQPKDIVSGDFYWTVETSDYLFFVTADCTGHGVPGGFMSVLGSSLLNEVIMENKVLEPCEILDLLRLKIIRSLKHSSAIESGNRDGMDMVLCRYSRNFKQMTFAGAYNPLWLFRDSKIQEYASDKQPVGMHVGELAQFTQTSIELKNGDIIYTFTDGYADQFGGPLGKKFKYRQFQELLIKNANLPMNEQAIALEKAFNAWKGELEQIDDVLVIGVRV